MNSKQGWTRRSAALVMSLGVVAGLTACAPGASAPTTSAALGAVSKTVPSGPITLTVWDQNVDGGIVDAQKRLNAEFEKKYPNITIKRTAQSFDNLKRTLRLALSGNSAPDVAQVNQGYPDMGAFVQAGLIRPLNDYSKLYGWSRYFPQSLLKQNSFSADGKTWQGDNLYGVSQTGELVGVYYNKKILSRLGLDAPSTLDELQSDMAAAKAKNVLPLAFGNLEKSPGIHVFGVTQASYAGASTVVDLVTGRSGAWTDTPTKQAAQTIADWTAKSYLTKGANGVSQDDALATFGKGGALFLITGTWQQQPLTEALGDDAGFAVLKSAGGQPATTGGQGLAWAISSKTKNADAAAAYVDFISNSSAAKEIVGSGNLSTVLPDSYQPEAGTLANAIATQYREVQKADGVVPYLDYTTTTFYDTLTSNMQNLVARQEDPSRFTTALQSDYQKFLESK